VAVGTVGVSVGGGAIVLVAVGVTVATVALAVGGSKVGGSRVADG